MIFIGLVGIMATIIWIKITIYSAKKVFFQSNLFENLKDGEKFFLEELGNYTIWIKTKAHKLNRLVVESPIVLDDKGEEIDLTRVLIPTTSTSFDGTGKTSIYNFHAKSGWYEFGIIDKPYSKIGSFMSNREENLTPINYIIKTKAKFIYYLGFGVGIFASIGFLILTVLSFVLGLV